MSAPRWALARAQVQAMAALAVTEICRGNYANQTATAEFGSISSLVAQLRGSGTATATAPSGTEEVHVATAATNRARAPPPARPTFRSRWAQGRPELPNSLRSPCNVGHLVHRSRRRRPALSGCSRKGMSRTRSPLPRLPSHSAAAPQLHS